MRTTKKKNVCQTYNSDSREAFRNEAEALVVLKLKEGIHPQI